MLDARRMEVYTAMYDQHLQVIENVNASIITEDAFNQFADREIVYFGDGASKCQSVLAGKSNLIFLDHINLTAKSVCMLAEEEFKAQNFADVAYCEPFYLKDFVAGKPRVKGLYWSSTTPVSYTHLDVYKRQVITAPYRAVSKKLKDGDKVTKVDAKDLYADEKK